MYTNFLGLTLTYWSPYTFKIYIYSLVDILLTENLCEELGAPPQTVKQFVTFVPVKAPSRVTRVKHSSVSRVVLLLIQVSRAKRISLKTLS